MLQAREVAVYLVSGGFRRIIEPYADHVAIPKSNIFANSILFNEEGTLSDHYGIIMCCNSTIMSVQ